jgi:hypothetical protein
MFDAAVIGAGVAGLTALSVRPVGVSPWLAWTDIFV